MSVSLGRSGPRILLADDSATIRRMVASRLERSGYSVLTAADGDEAFRIAYEEHPDLAILDVEMPGMTGRDVTRLLRAGAATSAMPVILLTSCDGEDDVRAGFEAGASDYITKPFSPQDLDALVGSLLGRRRVTAA